MKCSAMNLAEIIEGVGFPIFFTSRKLLEEMIPTGLRITKIDYPLTGFGFYGFEGYSFENDVPSFFLLSRKRTNYIIYRPSKTWSPFIKMSLFQEDILVFGSVHVP